MWVTDRSMQTRPVFGRGRSLLRKTLEAPDTVQWSLWRRSAEGILRVKRSYLEVSINHTVNEFVLLTPDNTTARVLLTVVSDKNSLVHLQVVR